MIEVRNEAGAAEIIIAGQIGGSWWDESGMTEKEFNDALARFPATQHVTIGINSEGGSVQDGLGIYNALKRRGNTTARIDGYALSIASVVALGADKVVSPRASVWMIHEPWAGAKGNADDLRRAAEMLEKHGEALSSIYESEIGLSRSQVRDMMRAETWFTGEEAVEIGLADESTSDPANLAPLSSAFRSVPKQLADIKDRAVFNSLSRFRVESGRGLTASVTENKHKDQQPKGSSMTNLLKALAEAKIIPTAALDDEAAAQFVRDYAKQTLDAQAAKDLRIEELESKVNEARKARAESIVDGAVKAGKIKDDTALRARWVAALMADEPGSVAMLDGIESPKAVTGVSAEDIARIAAASSTETPKLTGRARVAAAWAKEAVKIIGRK